MFTAEHFSIHARMLVKLTLIIDVRQAKPALTIVLFSKCNQTVKTGS